MAPKISAQKKRCDSWVPQKKKKNQMVHTTPSGKALNSKINLELKSWPTIGPFELTLHRVPDFPRKSKRDITAKPKQSLYK